MTDLSICNLTREMDLLYKVSMDPNRRSNSQMTLYIFVGILAVVVIGFIVATITFFT